MKNKRIVFIPADEKNMPYAEMAINSLRKFHSEEELPIMIVPGRKDPMFWYRATPVIARELLTEYETVIKLDADSIVTGDLSALWSGDQFDVAVVNNSNPREFKAYPYTYMNINPLSYVNCGLVAMCSESFVNFWYNMCFSPLFNGMQMKEQDALNILIHSNNYKVKRLDEGDSYYGLASKGYWPEVELREGKLVLPQSKEWPQECDKYIKVIHFAGGNIPNKTNYKIHFKPEVVKYLNKLVR